MRKGWQDKFIGALRENGNISRSAQMAGVSRTEVYNERAEQPSFAARWDDAVEIACDLMEEEARRRAYFGTRKPVYHQGVVCGEIQEYSDTLMIFLLKGARPQKFRENVRQEITGAGGGPVQMQVGEIDNCTDEELKKRLEAASLGLAHAGVSQES